MVLLLRPCHVDVKNQPKWCQEPFKNNSQINTPTCIDFGTNLPPFWEGFGSQVGAKLAPNRSKSRSKKWSKKWSPFGSLLGAILVDFGLQLGGQSSLGGGKALTFRTSFGVLVPLGAKMAPRPLQDPAKRALGIDFGRILDWWIFAGLCFDFGWLLLYL